jgi:hypothetical protein
LAGGFNLISVDSAFLCLFFQLCGNALWQELKLRGFLVIAKENFFVEILTPKLKIRLNISRHKSSLARILSFRPRFE